MQSCLKYSWILRLQPCRFSNLSHKFNINLELIYCHQKSSRLHPLIRFSHLALHLQAFHIK
jgi:hypothetical protein